MTAGKISQGEMSEFLHGTMLKLGTSKRDITPTKPVQLAGYGHRKGKPFDKVAHPLYARVFFFESDSGSGGGAKDKAVFIQGDLIWWGNDFTSRMQRQINEKWQVDEAAVIMNASHTHSGPQTSHDFLTALGEPDDDYLTFLEVCLLEAVAEAYSNMEAVTVERSHGECQVGIHRRRLVEGKYVNAPNPEGPIDPEVTVFRFQRIGEQAAIGADSGKERQNVTDKLTKAVWFHYTCHTTVMGEFTVSSEFTGVAMERIEQALSEHEAVAAFLQGTCGDVRPALVNGERFYRGKEEDVERLGGQLADEVLRVLRQPMQTLETSKLTADRSEVLLPFENLPAQEELNTLKNAETHIGEWAGLMLQEPARLAPSIPLRLNYVKLADGLAFVTMNGEVVVNYGLFVKELTRKQVLPLAYTNGMIGYIPTAEQLIEGGYESRDSLYYFGLPAAFTEEVEDRIKQEIRSLVGH